MLCISYSTNPTVYVNKNFSCLIYGRVPTKGRNNVWTRNLRIVILEHIVFLCSRCYNAAFKRGVSWYDKYAELAQSYAQVTVKALVLFTCYAWILAAPCLNSLIYLYPEDLTEGKDGRKGILQFLSLTLNHL